MNVDITGARIYFTIPIFGGIRNAFFIGPNGEQLELLQHL